jgi:NAD(P)-binding Rossmann-like domain
MSDLADSNPHPRCAKVAVVGSGLAGLTAAYLLSTVHQRADIQHNGGPVEYEVHVFEKVCARFPLPLFWQSLLIFRFRDTPTPFSLNGNAIVRQTHWEWTLNQFHLCYPARRGNGVLMCRCALSREASIPRDRLSRVG